MDAKSNEPQSARAGLGGALRDTAIYFFAQLGARALSFAFYFVLAGTLPVEEFGYLNFALVVVILVDMMIDLGLSRFASREVAKNLGEASWILRLFLPYKMVAALTAFVFVWIAVEWTDPDEQLRSIMLISALGLFLTAPSMLVENVLQAHEKFKLISFAHVALALSQGVLGLFAIWLSATTPVVTIVFVVANAVYLGVLLFGLKGLGISRVNNSRPRSFSDCLSWALPFMFGSIVMLLSTRIEFLVLSWFGSAADLGVYSLVARLGEVALLVPMALGSVLLPQFAAAHGGNRIALTDVYAKSLQLLLCASIPVSAVVWTFSFLLPMVLTKPELSESGALTAFQFLGYPGACIFVLNTFLLLGASQQRAALMAWTILALFQFVLNVALQNRFGIYGAVTASVVISYIGAITTTLLICSKYVEPIAVRAAIIPCLWVAAAIVVLMAVLSPVNPILALIVALFAYAFMVWRSGIARHWGLGSILAK